MYMLGVAQFAAMHAHMVAGTQARSACYATQHVTTRRHAKQQQQR
jgi:hypothetical protein